MNKRCIVNVATGEFYLSQQRRLRDSFESQIHGYCIEAPLEGEYVRGTSSWIGPVDSTIDMCLWKDVLPGSSRPHEQSPYGFKVHAFAQAYSKGYQSILWLDSPGYCVVGDVFPRSIDPIFEKIEKYGYYAMSHHDPLENWVGETALKRFGMTREQLKGFHLPSGSCYGFDLSQAWVRRLFDQFCQFEEEGLFKSEVIGQDKWHRHDEAILALLLIQFNLPVFFNDPLFQSNSPECVIRSGANWTQDAKVYGE